ncbi:hypothetical protein RUND412_001215 [Rhizina undulata]
MIQRFRAIPDVPTDGESVRIKKHVISPIPHSASSVATNNGGRQLSLLRQTLFSCLLVAPSSSPYHYYPPIIARGQQQHQSTSSSSQTPPPSLSPSPHAASSPALSLSPAAAAAAAAAAASNRRWGATAVFYLRGKDVAVPVAVPVPVVFRLGFNVTLALPSSRTPKYIIAGEEQHVDYRHLHHSANHHAPCASATLPAQSSSPSPSSASDHPRVTPFVSNLKRRYSAAKMTPPNSFSSSAFASMPSSFHPSIPSTLPSYPRPQHQAKRLGPQSYHHTQQQSSAAAGNILFRQAPQNPITEPGRKRIQRDFGESRTRFTAHSPPPLDPQDSDDEMRSSFYSDSAYRSTLVPSNSRKRGLADDDVDDYGYSTGGRRTEVNDGNPRGGKRRIIDVVGSVASRVWEFCKSKTPLFYASPPRVRRSETFQTPVASPTTQSGNNGLRYREMRFESPMSGQFFTDLAREPVGTTIVDYSNTSLQPSFTPDPSIKPTDVGLSTRWVMVSPTTNSTQPNGASTATTVGSRGATAPNRRNNVKKPLLQRPVSSVARKRVRPPIIPKPTPVVPQSQNFSVPSTSDDLFAFAVPRTTPPRTGNGTGSRPTSPRSRPGSSTASMANTRAGSWRKGHRKEKSVEFDEEDESMKRFNEQLKAMIREGKEALGSKVEIVYDDEEEMAY